MNLEELRQKAITFIGSIPKGRIPEALIAPEFFSWSGISASAGQGNPLAVLLEPAPFI